MSQNYDEDDLDDWPDELDAFTSFFDHAEDSMRAPLHSPLLPAAQTGERETPCAVGIDAVTTSSAIAAETNDRVHATRPHTRDSSLSSSTISSRSNKTNTGKVRVAYTSSHARPHAKGASEECNNDESRDSVDDAAALSVHRHKDSRVGTMSETMHSSSRPLLRRRRRRTAAAAVSAAHTPVDRVTRVRDTRAWNEKKQSNISVHHSTRSSRQSKEKNDVHHTRTGLGVRSNRSSDVASPCIDAAKERCAKYTFKPRRERDDVPQSPTLCESVYEIDDELRRLIAAYYRGELTTLLQQQQQQQKQICVPHAQPSSLAPSASMAPVGMPQSTEQHAQRAALPSVDSEWRQRRMPTGTCRPEQHSRTCVPLSPTSSAATAGSNVTQPFDSTRDDEFGSVAHTSVSHNSCIHRRLSARQTAAQQDEDEGDVHRRSCQSMHPQQEAGDEETESEYMDDGIHALHTRHGSEGLRVNSTSRGSDIEWLSSRDAWRRHRAHGEPVAATTSAGSRSHREDSHTHTQPHQPAAYTASHLGSTFREENDSYVNNNNNNNRDASLGYPSRPQPSATHRRMRSNDGVSHGGSSLRHRHRRTVSSGGSTLYGGATAATGVGGGVGVGVGGGGGMISFISSLPSYSSTSFVRAYVSDVNVSIEPAVFVSGVAAVLNIVFVRFIQNHVLDTHDQLSLFIIGSYLIFTSYYTAYYFLERFSDSFRRTSSVDKKFYIIGNLIKAGTLFSITPFAMYHLFKILVWNSWENNTLHNLGCIYTMPDFIAMMIVTRMRWSTWLHHFCVVLFNYFSIMNDYNNENVCRCLVVYAAFSTFGYCVNVLLASRFFHSPRAWLVCFRG